MRCLTSGGRIVIGVLALALLTALAAGLGQAQEFGQVEQAGSEATNSPA